MVRTYNIVVLQTSELASATHQGNGNSQKAFAWSRASINWSVEIVIVLAQILVIVSYVDKDGLDGPSR